VQGQSFPKIGVGVAIGIGIDFYGGCLNQHSSVFFKKLDSDADSDPDPDKNAIAEAEAPLNILCKQLKNGL
jgi:hypothetical protein